MTEPVLSVRELSTAFLVHGQWKTVVQDVSFNIRPNETLAIVGESGSGKSVTAMSVMRLLHPRHSRCTGSVSFAGRDLLAVQETEMRGMRGGEISMIFQEPMTSLNPVRTIGFQVAEALMLHRGLNRKDADAEAVRMLDRVRIPAARLRVKDYPHHFSGGMRQRVMIAMALACRPKLLIADEPTTALDVTIQAQILDLIRDLQDEYGMSVLFITHDLGVVSEIAHRCLVMRDGRQIEGCSTEELFRNPVEPYTRALLAAVPKLGSMKSVPRPLPFPIVDRDTGAIRDPEEMPDTVKSASPPALEIRDLVVRYNGRSGLFARQRGSVHAVQNVSFSIQPGETLALVGESGCGKSTIGRTIMRLVDARSGEIRVNGHKVSNKMQKDRKTVFRQVQMVFQDPFSSLNPRKTIGSAIADPMRINGIADGEELKRRVDGLLSRVGLDPAIARRYPHEFSGGQRQRICIARCLALEPSVVIADEAVSALDVSIKAQVVNLLLELQKSMNLAYLFISHDMGVVERVSHRVAVMYMGEIVEVGPRASVLYDPQHAYTRKLLDAVPVADPQVKRTRRDAETDEINSDLRPRGYQPPVRHYEEVSPGHFVMK
ncbi:ABC transporter ATP-binding protein [Agrobacterium vitis]|uniref:ABC transporter ATP-binding protein n=1 Tax=Agrobacterium vitis TaxID=373 RepID=UPI001F22366D|nr:ABC transporter ATP-binding protein [Agrobacterium vitis]MCF1467518.1 ABC transporter ATP-binding protein [Agrobacterium vitis]